ncbi:MAG: DJ-1/PfpI family protein [Telluria sp.]
MTLAAAILTLAAAVPALPLYANSHRHARPLVAVLGQNAGTELTDFVLPYAILARSGVAEVQSVGLRPGLIRMRPASVAVQPQADAAGFDADHPEGADYVIVPAVVDAGDKELGAWLRAQAAKGATLVSICDGAMVLAEAGLLKGRQATGHWASYGERSSHYPDTRWMKNVRYVADGNVMSSAGISASIPMALALVEAMGGAEAARRSAAAVGVDDWSPAHDSERYRRLPLWITGAWNMVFHGRDDVGLPLEEGSDDIALALEADMYSRTYRSHAYTVAASSAPVRARSGLLLVAEQAKAASAGAALTRPVTVRDGAPLLDQVLADIGARYGSGTARLVAAQMEYAWEDPR